jgi:hypothetical protein
MRRCHDGAVGVAYGNGGQGGALVDDRSGNGGEVGGATGVGDSNVWFLGGMSTEGGTYWFTVW